MSRRLYINGDFVKFTVGAFSGLNTRALPVEELLQGPIVPPDLMDSTACRIETKRLMDLGGSGDCFFIALNAAISYYTMCNNGEALSLNASDIYELLGVPEYTYIEDKHIEKFSGLLPFSVVIVREYEGTCHFCQYGDKGDCIFILNDYQAHNLLFDQILRKGDHRRNDQLNIKPNDEARVGEVESVPLITEFPPVYEAAAEMTDAADGCYKEEVDIGYLYQYVDTRYQIRKAGKSLKASDSKNYYKLRHNVFKTLFLDMLGLASTKEMPFTSYGVDSNRTPDLILQFGDKLILLEFTVVKRFATSILTKKSQNKYAAEVGMIRSSGREVVQYYPTLSLDESVSSISLEVVEIASLLGKDLFVDPESSFASLQSELNSLEYNMLEMMPEMLQNQDEHQQIKLKHDDSLKQIPDLFPVQVEKIGIKRQRDQSTFALIRKNIRSLERQLKSTRYSAKFVIIVNRRHNRIYADVDSAGLQKNRLLSLIQNSSYDMLQYVKYVGQIEEGDEPFQGYGTVKFQVSEDRDQLVKEKVDVEPYERYYKAKLKKGADARSMPTLADSNLQVQSGLVRSKYEQILVKQRLEPRIKIYNKNWFVFPIMTCCSVGDFVPLKVETGLLLTDRLIRQCVPCKHDKVLERNMDLEGLDNVLKDMNKKYMVLLSFLNNDKKKARLVKNVFTEAAAKSKLAELGADEGAFEALKEYQKSRSAMGKKVNEPTRQAYKNRITLPASYIRHNWPVELEHFGSTKSEIKVCEGRDLGSTSHLVSSLTDALWQELPFQTVDDVYSNTDPLGNQLKTILEEMKNLGNETMDALRKTQIMHDLEFISRVAYSVMYYSNVKSNKEDFFYDNIGYVDALVLVKGGKKILSHKKSRLFKLIFPINERFSWLYCSPTTKIVKSAQGVYCVLPWQTWSFQMLKKATELYYSFSNFFVCSYLESGIDLQDFKKFTTTKVLNMYSQRRKVEIWFGFFRYLYLNSMATHTSVLDLIEDMVDHEYDPYFSHCQRVFAARYANLYRNAVEGKIYDIMTEVVVENFDLCAEKFDESIFMTVAPFDRVNEHLRNLRSVLKTHKDVIDKFGADPIELLNKTRVDVSQDDYFERLQEDDLMFDPKLVYSIGYFAGEHYNKCTSLADLSSEFANIVDQSFTSISTSKGLRSSKGSFWGDKGHDVIFDKTEMLDPLKSFVKDLPSSHSEFRKVLLNTEVSFREKIAALSNVTLEFDIKDKAQWKGSREIYVMSDNTKILQSPLEKFFKFLCTWVPNELIHKKSHVRPKFIHSQVFEFEDTGDECLFATLDCRKWAPKSNLWKYYYFVKGMGHHLPKEFTDYFFAVWGLMFSKKVRIQSAYVEKLEKNAQTAIYKDYLTLREDGDYEFVMPYSFMMGIFNYLSSLLHAFSQLYFDAKIARAYGVSLNLLAHSDDSGGVIFSRSMEKNLEVYRMYEMFQKGVNHLMSKKKCSLSRNFFEMISIMYANKRLIPMTHKFISNVSFEPKGKGWVDDISTIVSKVVEVFSNGGSMLQCYLTMITMSEMIRKFYHIPRVRTLSSIPLAYGGVFNLHPIHLILLGADAQEVLLDVVETPGERAFRISVGESIFGEYFPGKGCNVNYHIPYYKRHKLLGEFSDNEMDLLKLFSSVNPRSTLGQAAGHYSRLRDPAYVYSLSGVDMCQIFVMTLYSKVMVMNYDSGKRGDLRKLSLKYSVLKSLGLFGKRAVKGYSNFHHYAKASEGIKLKLGDMCVASKKTCKPMIYDTFSNLGLGMTFQMLNEIVAYRKEPRLEFMFPDKIRMESLVAWVKTNLQYSDDYTLEDYLMKVSGKDLEKTRSSYCFIPSGVNVDTVERFWTYVNFYCTRRYYISSQKPQYFTIDQFKLWNADYEGIKHVYLLVKIALRAPLSSNVFDKLKKNSDCPGCGYKEASENILSEIFRIRNLPSYSFLTTDLPFAVYTSAQSRSINVWYGKAEFILYTRFGNVEATKRFGQMHHIYTVEDSETLDQLHFLLTNFLVTRGLMENQVAYSINDSAQYKLGFNDLHQPRLVYPGERAMLMAQTTVYVRPPQKVRLYKEGDKITTDGLSVDFEIYQNYDINETFYKDHKLDAVKNLIFDEEKQVDNEDLKRSALHSKAYEILQEDPSHSDYGTILDKYQPGLLLGSERSLTRALINADRKGVTNYRSSSSPSMLDTAILEGVSHKDIPVVDLANAFSFARVTYKERNVMDKLVNEVSVREEDVAILDRLVTKLGVKPTMNALVTTRLVFSELIYWDVLKLSPQVLHEYLLSMTKSALMCINERFEGVPEYHVMGSPQQVYQQLSLAIGNSASPELFAELLTKLYLRAQKTDPGRFWDERKDCIYSALVVPNKSNFKVQYMFNKAVLSKLGKERYKSIENLRQIRVANKMVMRNLSNVFTKVKKLRKKGTEYFEGVPKLSDLEETGYFLNEDSDTFEDDMDAVSGGDDPESFEERSWDEDGDDYESFIFNNLDMRQVMEDTIQEDFASVTIYSLTLPPNFPWLGGCDVDIESLGGVPMYKMSYPGKLTKVRTINDMKEKKVSRNESKPIPVEAAAPLSKWANKKSVGTDIFKLETEEDVYEYQKSVLENIGIVNIEEHEHNFFKLKDVSNEKYFWSNFFQGMRLSATIKIDSINQRSKRRTNVLPGFTGNLRDDDLRAELNAMFQNHAEEIVSGNQCLTPSSYKTILRNFRRLYREHKDPNLRAYIIIMLSTMRDCVLGQVSDSWYSDSLMSALDSMEEDLSSVTNDEAPPPLNTQGFKREYKIHYPFD
uniref:RNA-directed RNA polymerase L n=1 Tax=Phytophthora palustris bunya-like virus 5 TaxID=2976284 RepID=A0A9E8YZJ1_9VIRU|nr:RNA-dependent RNA polymerase [Phytophthora palustris bunya-like virus 5]